MRALRITAGLPLPEALVHFMNLLPAHCSESSSSSPNSSDTNKGASDTENFDFNEMSYLEAKNEIDKLSFNQEILTMLSKQLDDRIHQRFSKKSDVKNFPLVAVDLGAGLLNMLPKVQKLFSDASGTLIGNNEMELQYVAFENNKNIEKHTIKKLTEQLGFKIIPSSVDLTAETASTIRADIKSFKKIITMPEVNGTKERTMIVTVHLVAEDFMSENALKILNDVLGSHRCSSGKKVNSQNTKYTPSRPQVDLFVGCCVADLISPSALANQVLEMAGDGGGLLYLPITFCGQTNIIKYSKELQIFKGLETGLIQESSPRSVRIPEDSEVFSLYHNHLEKMGHYLGPDRLLSELEAYGYSVLLPPSSKNVKSAASNWQISKNKNPYMWKCMVRFIALGTAFQAMGIFDLKSWFNNLNENKNDKDCDMMIDVSNIDILAVLPEIVQKILSPQEMVENTINPEASHDALMCTDFGSPPADAFRNTPLITRLPSNTAIHTSDSENKIEKVSEIASKLELFVPTARSSVEFLSPGVVHVVEEPVPALGNYQLLVRTTCSLVSTGTELKIFSGDLDIDQPADLTISGMEDKMSYPLRYGYSSVGRVVAVGSSLNETAWLGQLVFSFSPHSTAVVVDASSVMIVPKGILPEDAVFLPSVETAISLIQAARPNIGEKILVVGQGLIGLLTGAVLTHHLSNAETTICDVSEKRLSAASLFNDKALLWNPSNKLDGRSDYDLSIEVSGNPRGLQTAIDSTGINGRIVVGSWYGEKPTPLKLGLKFHRSGLQLITSQVSNIYPELSGRWDKIRRFDLTWETLKHIKPSKLISSIASLKSDEVLAAYIRLQKGEDVTVLFRSD